MRLRDVLPAALLLAAGCSPASGGLPGVGPSAAGGGTAMPAGACVLLTRAEVGAALGEPIDEPIDEQELADYGCSYTPATAVSSTVVSLELSPGSAFAQRKQYFMRQGGKLTGGLGDEAYAKGGAILVLQKQTIVYLVVLRDGWDDRQRFGAAHALIVRVLGRVP